MARDAQDHRYVRHQGSMDGTRAALLYYSEQKLAVAILSNLSNISRDIESLAVALAQPFWPDA